MEAESKATPLYSGQRVVRVTIKRLKRCQQSSRNVGSGTIRLFLCYNISTTLHIEKKEMVKEPYTDASISLDACSELYLAR